MTVTLHPAAPSDFLDLARCNNTAFQSDPLFQAAFNLGPTATPEEHAAHLDFRKDSFEKLFDKTNIHLVKAVDISSGTLVGYFRLNSPQDTDSKTDEENPRELGDVPESFNRELLESTTARFWELKDGALGVRKDVWYLGALAVMPSYQGRGIGKQLLLYALELADAQSGDVYLESDASSEARKLYARNGFETMGEVRLMEGYSAVGMLRRSPAHK